MSTISREQKTALRGPIAVACQREMTSGLGSLTAPFGTLKAACCRLTNRLCVCQGVRAFQSGETVKH